MQDSGIKRHSLISIILARLARCVPRRTLAQRRGREGERLAERWLRRHCGYRTVARNWRWGRGELDLVMSDRVTGSLVFVEVRGRAAHALVGGYHSVTARKRRILRRTILAYLARGKRARAWRFDIVEIAWSARADPVIRHHRGASL